MVQQEHLRSENEYSPPPEPGRTHVTISNIIVNGGGRAIQGSRQKSDIVFMIESIVMTGEEKHEWIVTRSLKPDRRFAVSQTKKARDKSRNTDDDPFALPLIGSHGRIDILISRHTLAFRFAANELDSHILRIHARESTHRLRFEFRHIYCSGKLNIIIKRDVEFD